MADFQRQLDILPPRALIYPVHCIGLGGIGSNVAFYLRKMGFTNFSLWDYDVVEPGYNYRLDEIRASLGLSQLKRIQKLNSMRKKAFEYYNLKLKEIPGIITPTLSGNDDNAYHLYIIRIQKKYGMSRDQLFRKLLDNGISTSAHYKPLHEFTAFKKWQERNKDLKNATELYGEIISLPFYPNISRLEQDLVIKGVRK